MRVAYIVAAVPRLPLQLKTEITGEPLRVFGRMLTLYVVLALMFTVVMIVAVPESSGPPDELIEHAGMRTMFVLPEFRIPASPTTAPVPDDHVIWTGTSATICQIPAPSVMDRLVTSL